MQRKMIVIIIAAIFMAVYSGRSIPGRRFIAMDNNNNPGCPHNSGQDGKYAGSASGLESDNVYLRHSSCNISGPFYATRSTKLCFPQRHL